MAKRKKYPKLPNGYGSIRYLGKNRRNPYAVHPPTEEFKLNGSPVRPPALCYVDTWIKGFTVLTALKAGTYTPGMEKTLESPDTDNLDGLAQKILADYNRIKDPKSVHDKKPTFTDIYEKFFEYKFERDKSREYSEATKKSTRAAYKNCSILHQRQFDQLRHADLQGVIDDCPLKHSSKELIISLLHQMYEYAMVYEYVDRDFSSALKINTKDDDEHGIPFSDDELATLWQRKDDPVIGMVLIMCYSGFRISAYKNIKINLEELYFQGGVKNASSKDRIVPIHSGIIDLVHRRLKREKVLITNVEKFRREMKSKLSEYGMNHTPHDCRHTFSMLCEKYGVNENDRKRMLGHSFGADVTNAVYGHRSVEDLRMEIEKIKTCN